jgi:DNA-binding MarR family transcriptional regulator
MKKSIGRLVSILHRQSQIYINFVLKDFGISSAEYSFLLYLYYKDGITQDSLSSYLYIDKAATARAIKSLEQKGYVTKDKDTTDKRCNRIYLTEKAVSLRDTIRNKVFSWSEFLTNGIDDTSIDMVYSILEKMVEKVERTNLKKQLEEM